MNSVEYKGFTLTKGVTVIELTSLPSHGRDDNLTCNGGKGVFIGIDAGAPLWKASTGDEFCYNIKKTDTWYKVYDLPESPKKPALTLEMLKTGMIVEYKSNFTGDIHLVMVLLNTANGDIISGETWKPLTERDLTDIISVWQPDSNRSFLNKHPLGDHKLEEVGLSLDDCTLVWKREPEKDIKRQAIEEDINSLQDKINELKSQLENL